MKFSEKIKNWKQIDPASVARSIGRFWGVATSREIDIKTKRELLMGSKRQKVEFLKETELPSGVTHIDYKVVKETPEEIPEDEIPEEVAELKKDYDIARTEKNWQAVDELKDEISKCGYDVEDRNGKSFLRKNTSSPN
jgi:cysteinyl-tRNA synthetase